MDINNNTQINTFTGGMNTDTADSLMPSDQYRMAHNMRLGVKDGEQGGLLYTIEGSSDAFITDEDGGDVLFENIIASSQIRNYGVVIDNTAKGWCVYRLKLSSVGSLTATKVFGPCGEDRIEDKIGEHPTIVCRWESDDNVKAYIADGKHPIMLVNIMKDNGHNISNISSIAEHTFGGFERIDKISGELKPAIIQYAYQLYNKYGSQSQVSPLSQCFVVRDDDGNKGLPYSENSQTGFEITIDEHAGEFKKIKLYRITYQQNGQQPTVDLIADAELPENDEFKYRDTGGIELDTLSVAEFIAQDNIVLIPKEIESKGDYLFASNVKYQIEENAKLIQKFYEWDTKSMDSGKENNLSFSTNYDPSAWKAIQPDVPDWWNGRNSDQSCKWKYITQSKQNQKDLPKSLRRGEIYRYGLVLYDKYGTAWPVKWIADIRTPELRYNSNDSDTVNANSCPLIKETEGQTYQYVSLGLRFDIKLPEELKKHFTKYEIVRCNRTAQDRCTITQGILGRALETYYYGSAVYKRENNTADEYYSSNESTNYLCPSGFMTASNILVYSKGYKDVLPSNDQSRFAKSSDNVLLFSSPEYCYQKDDIQNIIKQYKSALSICPVEQYKNAHWHKHVLGTQNEGGVESQFDDKGDNWRMYYECASPYEVGMTYGTVYEETDNSKAYAPYISRLRICLKVNRTEVSTGWFTLQDAVDQSEVIPEKHKTYRTVDGLFRVTNVDGNKCTMSTVPEGYQKITCTEVDKDAPRAFCFATWRFRQQIPYYCADGVGSYDDYDFRHNNNIYQQWDFFQKIISEKDSSKTIFNKFEWSKRPTDSIFDEFIPQLIGVNRGNFAIDELKYVDVPKFNEFESNKIFTFKNKQTPIENKNFVPWSVPTIVNLDSAYSRIQTMFDYYDFYNKSLDDLRPRYYSENAYEESIYNYPIGSCGESMIIKLSDSSNMFNANLSDNEIANPLCTTICNIRKTNTVPYGGFTDYARTHSTYYSHGVNGEIDDNGEFVVDSYDGDCFVRNFTYNALKTWYSPNCKYALNMASVYIFPVETDVDILNDYGNTYTREPSDYIQDYAATLRGYTQQLPAYMYNTAYSVDPNVKFFTGQDEDEFSRYKFDYRVCYSNPKTNDETTDSWLRFKSANYLDVDTRFGEITNLRLFKDTLMFWQNDAVGVLSANERTVLQDVNDTNIILGNGDILQRFDYITTQYGMKPNQYADTQSNTSLYWWDGYRKEILQFKSGQGFTPLKVAKTVAAFINDSGDADNPALCYDSKYNEILMNVLYRNIGPTYLPSTLAYNEYIEKFTGVYDQKFNSSVHIENYLYMCLRNTKNNAIKVWDSGTVNNSSVEYVVNKNPQYTKVYDNMIFEGKYSNNLNMDFTTPLNQSGSTNQNAFTKIENDYRLAIPRNGSAEYGDRLRGKTMDVTITSSNDLSIQHALTKYRISWS